VAHTRREMFGGMATVCVSPGLATGQLATKKGEPSPTRDNHVRKFFECDSASRNLQAIYFDENGGNHDFPPIVREQTYAWLDQNLQHTSASKLAPVSGL